MSDQDLTLLQQALAAQQQQLAALKSDELALGATTDGQTTRVALTASRTWKNGWGARAYVASVFGPAKPRVEGGVEVVKKF